MRTTKSLIAENAKYVRQTGYDRPWIVAELWARADKGDRNAQVALGVTS